MHLIIRQIVAGLHVKANCNMATVAAAEFIAALRLRWTWIRAQMTYVRGAVVVRDRRGRAGPGHFLVSGNCVFL